MKTKCYCIFCKHHPFHDRQKEFKNILCGWDVGDFISIEEDKQGVYVDCLEPRSDAFYDLEREAEDFSYPVTAYGDGYSVTGCEGSGYLIRATCGNEDDEEL